MGEDLGFDANRNNNTVGVGQSSFPLLQEREVTQADSFSAGDSPAPFLSGGIDAGE